MGEVVGADNVILEEVEVVENVTLEVVGVENAILEEVGVEGEDKVTLEVVGEEEEVHVILELSHPGLI
jgi:hypothetical protein